MAESLLQNQRPLNRKAKELLLQKKEELIPEMPYLVQLVIVGLNGALPDTLVERLYRLNPQKVMKVVEPNLTADELEGSTPYQAALQIAEAMELDLHALGL